MYTVVISGSQPWHYQIVFCGNTFKKKKKVKQTNKQTKTLKKKKNLFFILIKHKNVNICYDSQNIYFRNVRHDVIKKIESSVTR